MWEEFLKILGILVLLILSVWDMKFKEYPLWIILVGIFTALAADYFYFQMSINQIGSRCFVGIATMAMSCIKSLGIGMGDGLVLIFTGLLIGNVGNLKLIITSIYLFLGCFIFSLTVKKAEISHEIPFIPFITIGFIETIW